jgi:hypothetical protein
VIESCGQTSALGIWADCRELHERYGGG